MVLGYTKELDVSFEAAEELVRKSLIENGFGIMTKGDVKIALSKAGFEFEDYVILGACYPEYAYKALNKNPELGLLLPCNVILYKKEDKIVVSAINPVEAMSMVKDEEIKEVAKIIKEKLEKVINDL